MNVQRRKSVLFTIVLVFLLAVPLVLGADILNQVFRPFAGTDIGATYNRYYYFIDAIIYFILFIGIAQFALGEKFKESKTVPIILGVILAIGAAVFEQQTGFNFGKMWWFAGLLIFLMLGGAIYTIAKRFGANTLIAFSLAYIAFYLLIQSTAPVLLDKILSLNWLGAIISILFVLAIGGLIYGIVKLFKDIKSGERDWNKSEDEAKTAKKGWGSIFDKEKRAAKKVKQVETEQHEFEEQLKKMQELEANLNNQQTLNRTEQITLLTQLENTLNMTWRMQEGIQNVISKIGKPEYEKYAENMQKYADQLNEFVNTVRRIISQLKEKIDKTREEEKNELDVEKRIQNLVQKVSIDEQKLLNSEKQYEFMQHLDPEYYEVIRGRIAQTNTKITESLISKEDQARLHTDYLKKIQQLDEENDRTIQKMLDLTTKNNFQTLRFQYMSKVYGLDFIKSQSLAQLFKYTKELKEKIMKIADLKNRFDAEIAKIEELIKNKVTVLNQAEQELDKDLEEVMNESFQQYKKIDQVRIKYYLVIYNILNKIIAQAENFKQNAIIPDFTQDFAQLTQASDNVTADIKALPGKKDTKNKKEVEDEIKKKIVSIIKEIKGLFFEDKKKKTTNVNASILSKIKNHKQKLETDIQTSKKIESAIPKTS